MTPTPVLSAYERVLLAAIRTHPDEDTPRLAYADALDERDTVWVKCPEKYGEGWHSSPPYVSQKWVCETCKGIGTVPDTESSVRAELIRVQIELAGCIKLTRPNGVKEYVDGYYETALRYELRERKLLEQNRAVLYPKCAACKGNIRMGLGNCTFCANGEHGLSTGYVGTFTRGLITEVRVPSIESVLVEEDCTRCQGYGYLYDGGSRDGQPCSFWQSKLKRTCEQCNGACRVWLVTDYARELFRICPALACVTPMDRVPATLNDSTECHWFANENDWPHGVSGMSGSQKLPWLVAMRLRRSARTLDCRNSWEQATYLQRIWYFATPELALAACGTGLCDVISEILEKETT